MTLDTDMCSGKASSGRSRRVTPASQGERPQTNHCCQCLDVDTFHLGLMDLLCEAHSLRWLVGAAPLYRQKPELFREASSIIGFQHHSPPRVWKHVGDALRPGDATKE